jgi:nucleotidyltransferase substrate binding protein (TIGR01987 family)
MLDFGPLHKALQQLQISLRYSESDLAKQNLELARVLRAAAIQAFEYTFELCIKMLTRQLEAMNYKSNVDFLSYRDLIRVSAEKGLLDDPSVWFHYRELRNITSHTYDNTKAEEVYSALPAFANDASMLLKHLEKANQCS